MFFYQQRTLVTSFSSSTNAALALIGTDETNHVNFLRGVLGNAAITAPTLATFDFTAKGAFNPADATTYLTLAQALEDTGVRAYKGAAPLSAVMANKTVLTAALNIHSVEARHASHIRAIRRAASNGSAASVTQGAAGSNPGVVLSGSTLTAASAFPAAAFSEAFDEGLDVGTVASIANNFSVSGSYFG
jgi:hypothetical protein